ncbi:Golgi-associated RAB2 interactor protein 6-like [Vicugna pacos]|uniref:Golgi-associated RAB2 interactor protein 6-like n=1 Tax=Vicugna pacos TaxID=30538 RepID=A0ABM5CKF6_VICPA
MAMDSSMMLSYGSSQSCHVLPMFSSSKGKLQQQLDKGEYDLFKQMPVFESDFIQVSKRGEVIDVHNRVEMVTVGITFSSPNLTIPDVMLLARPVMSCAVNARHDKHTRGRGFKSADSLELTRLLPLSFVKLSIYNYEKQQICLKIVTGRSFYLQLCTPSDTKEDLFAHWEDLVHILRPPVEAYSGTQAEPVGDMMGIPVLDAEDKRSPAAVEFCGDVDQDQVSVRSLPMVAEPSEDTSLAYAGGEGIQQHASHTHLLREKHSFLIPVPSEPDHVAASRAAASRATVVSARGSVNTAREEVISRRATKTAEGPRAGPSVSTMQSRSNLSAQDVGRRVSQLQAEDLTHGKKQERIHTKRATLLRSSREDKSVSKSRRSTWGGKREKRSRLFL